MPKFAETRESPPFLPKLWAFYKRDWQLALTYRFLLLWDVAQTSALLVSFFFISKLLNVQGGDYFRFVFLGVAFSSFMTTALSSLNQTIGLERKNGTLEAILLTPTSFTTVAIGKVLCDLSFVIGKVGVYLLFGIFFFRVNLSQANWITALPAVGLTVSTFLGVGMFTAGFFLLTREAGPLDRGEGSPLERLLGWGSRFLGGVYFPIALLPDGLRRVSDWLPLTCMLEAVRKSLIQGTSIQAVARELAVLLGLSLFLLPAGFLFLHWAFNEARRQGILSFED